MKFNDKAIELLRKNVELTYGKTVTSNSDCIQISDLLEIDGHNINPQTLRRFFGLVKYDGGFSRTTISALRQFGSKSQYDGNSQEIALFLEDIFDVEVTQP